MLFDSWHGLARVLIVGTLAYAILVIALRASGKRTLSKMNAFDFVVTVALGSTLATVITSESVALAEGALALALLVFLQYAVAWFSVRSGPFARAVKAEPVVLYHAGEFNERAMRRERIRRDEILAAAREAGVASLASVHAVVLETAGELSVIRDDAPPPPDRLSTLPAAESARARAR